MILSIHYPNQESRKEIIITSSIAGALLYLLLIIYQPFGTSGFEHRYKYLLLFPYAIIGTFSFCCINFLLRNNKRKWTIGLELLKVFLMIWLTSVLSYFYNSLFLSKVPLSLENYWYMFLYTLALGLPVSPLYILARYIYLNKKYGPVATLEDSTAISASVIRQEVDRNETSATIRIDADYGNFSLEIAQDDFVYAEAVDNYCIIHYYKSEAIQKAMIRISLSRLLNQIQTDVIKRVHRSFIVNLGKVSKYKGNASGYKISLHNADKDLMVSRSYVGSVIPALHNLAARP